MAHRAFGAVAACACVVLVVACLNTHGTAQTEHEAVYLVGGNAPPQAANETSGVLILDARGATPALTSLFSTGHYSRFGMDADNKHVLVGIEGASIASTLFPGIKAGLYRFDPTTSRISTVYSYATQTAYDSVHNVEIDHNGDYICQVRRYDYSVPSNNGNWIWKISHGVVTTILGTTQLGRTANLTGKMTTDIGTGEVLIGDFTYQTTPTTVRYPILSLDVDSGRIGTWNTGGAYGWYPYYSLTQRHDTGAVEGPFANAIFRVESGSVGRTTIAAPQNTPFGFYGAGKHDLQTAPNPRFVAVSYSAIGATQTYLYHFDASTWAVTSIVPVSTMRTYNYAFEFYRGRHTQAVRILPNRWQIRLCSPRHAGKRYAIAASLSGTAPGYTLADGRRINLSLDAVSLLTLANVIPSVFDPGAGVLDSRGVAAATLDLHRHGTLGVPLWIAWAVLDPHAPEGVAYLPDTYVMRI